MSDVLDNSDHPSAPSYMTWEEITRIKITEGVWRKSLLYVCANCNFPAYYNPFTNVIWGCKKCGFTTASISVYFKKLDGGMIDMLHMNDI